MSSSSSSSSHVIASAAVRRVVFVATPPPPFANIDRICRAFSISRHPDPLARHGTLNSIDDEDDDLDEDDDGSTISRKKLLTADDMEYLDDFLGLDQLRGGNKRGGKVAGAGYDDIFSTGDDDDDGDEPGGMIASGGNGKGRMNDGEEGEEENAMEAAYRVRQKSISDELDGRTGRLWTESWTITDEEWMADETWDDIEDWKPSLATRKSLENVKVYSIEENGGLVEGVPTLEAMSRMSLPKSLPPHPGHGTPAVHASHRKRAMRRKLLTSIQIAIHDDLLKIVNDMKTHDEKQAAVDVLYETIEDRVREREPVLSKLPDFAMLVEDGLEDVLTMVQERMNKAAKMAYAERWRQSKMTSAMGEAGEGGDNGDESGTPRGGGNKLDGKAIDVMGVNEDVSTPIFMDVLAATRHIQRRQQQQQQRAESDVDDAGGVVASNAPCIEYHAIPKFFSHCNDDGVPNLLYPLTVHPKEGVGRMVEEWQLAANKETKRIMMRDAMAEIANIVVEATTDAVADGTTEDDAAGPKVATVGAARVLVTGKRGVGKVRGRTAENPPPVSLIFFSSLVRKFTPRPPRHGRGALISPKLCSHPN